MILLYLLLGAVVVALLSGGSLSALGKVNIKGGWLALLAFAVQALAIIYSANRATYLAVLLVLTHLTVAGVFLYNYRLPGLKLAALGLALNLVVMAANGGWMPITPEAAGFVQGGTTQFVEGMHPPASKDIVLSRENTRLWIMSDIIYLSFPRRTVISLGDVFLVSGATYFIFSIMLKNRRGAYASATH